MLNLELFVAFLLITVADRDARPRRDARDRHRRHARGARRACDGPRHDHRQRPSGRLHRLRPELAPEEFGSCLRDHPLGWRRLPDLAGHPGLAQRGPAVGAFAAAGQGAFLARLSVALSNPKTIAFFTAFLPQFVDPDLPAEFQLVVMCAVSVLMAALLDSAWAMAAGLGRAWSEARPRRSLAACRAPSSSAAASGFPDAPAGSTAADAPLARTYSGLGRGRPRELERNALENRV